jgi:hypothetical protein
LELLDAEFTRDSFANREGHRRIAQLIGVSEKINFLSIFILIWLIKFTLNKYLFLIASVVISERSPTCPSTWSFTSRQPRLQLTKQIANIVDHRIKFLVNANKVILFGIKTIFFIDLLSLLFLIFRFLRFT